MLSDEMLRCVYAADIGGLKSLINAGESVRGTDRDGRTVLMHAILATPTEPSVISVLLDAGVDINAKDKGQNWTALAFAARDCSAEICRMLLDAGAEIEAVDIFGNTALWRAVMARKQENVMLLVERGANPDFANKSGVSPRQVAETTGWTMPEQDD